MEWKTQKPTCCAAVMPNNSDQKLKIAPYVCYMHILAAPVLLMMGVCMAQSVFVDMTSPPLGCNTELSYQHSSVEGVKATQDRAVYLKCQQFINGALEAIFYHYLSIALLLYLHFLISRWSGYKLSPGETTMLASQNHLKTPCKVDLWGSANTEITFPVHKTGVCM